MPMTVEERRAKDAERKRKSRAAAAAKREAERAKARTESDASAPTTMRDAVETALAAMKWLQPSDEASVTQARELARDVDELRHEGDRVRSLSAHRALSRVLNDLGGTPTMRLQHELRSLRAAEKSGGEHGGDGEGTAGKPAGNVSRFERPAKRRA